MYLFSRPYNKWANSRRTNTHLDQQTFPHTNINVETLPREIHTHTCMCAPKTGPLEYPLETNAMEQRKETRGKNGALWVWKEMKMFGWEGAGLGRGSCRQELSENSCGCIVCLSLCIRAECIKYEL